MIQSFQCKDTHSLFLTRRSKLWSTVQSVALRKLDQLDAATRLDDLRVPPGDRLEQLQGTRESQHSIRIDDQWRICFTWQQDGANDVELVDYHS
jgi:proteic killer suppression protein